MTDTTGENPGAGEPERHAYKAEVARILELMVHSVYTEKEVFLRELISNASDALDKLRYQALTEPDLIDGDPELAVTIRIDKDAASVSVTDNGIGMDRTELIENLGTIARSGTRAFLDQMQSDQDDTRLIGQFGVGFYSAFIVADRVEVRSRKAGTTTGHIWTSAGEDGFAIEEIEGGQPRGTTVTVYLGEQARNFLEEHEIERVVKTYSDHILFPIRLGDRQINSASALWNRPKSELGEEDYTEFFHHTSGQIGRPSLTIHYRAEGRSEYAVLLFVPATRPFDLFTESRKGRVKLYVRRVFITEDAELLPAYLRFVAGVIDSEDMPLNISREMLQNNPMVAAIRGAVTKRVLNELKKLADDAPDDFVKVWENFGAVLKEGLYEDPERRDALFELCRFRTTIGDGWRSLTDYVGDLKENQTAIYYMTGDTLEQLRASPQLEGFAARGLEVLLLTDPIDSFWVTTAVGYDGKPFQSITQGAADLSAIPLAGDAADQNGEHDNSDKDQGPPTPGLLERVAAQLGDAVGGVEFSKRLVDSPACLVAPGGGPDRALEKLLARQDHAIGQAPILELNPDHTLTRAMQKRLDTGDTEALADLAWLVFDQALILEGGAPKDPAAFAERLNRWVLKALG